ncbi:hypothetical protein CO2235_10007 [Cupriavidus oxalaticus]|uniref:Uncharacterized protein n=1 Tax=Cupriavidus oxalaticus TaxID=96344 RepID=A0A976G812_9BURK|nr:hypothetical protein CO2235_10007 [Cupriavidus oxalaticus]
MQRVDQFVARGIERFGRGVQVQAVAAFVLHLGQQDRLALEGRRAADPVALGQHADDLGVRVLGNLPYQCLAVGRRHPVLRLDLAVGSHTRVESGLADVIVLRGGASGGVSVAGNVQALGVHSASSGRGPRPVGTVGAAAGPIIYKPTGRSI